MRIRITVTTAYHSQSDSQFKHTNQTIEITQCYISELALNVDFIEFLSALKQVFNNNINISISHFFNQIIYDFNLTNSFDIITEDKVKNFKEKCKIHQQKTQNTIT